MNDKWKSQQTAHIGDYYSAKLHGGISLTQAMADPKKASELVARAMKPRPLFNPECTS